MRPGRFDRHIRIDLPDFKGRKQILEVHSKNKKLWHDVDLENVAKRCIGMSGAELANVMNEAAINSARKNSNFTTNDDINEAIDRISIG